jgi:hypothetical protein
MHSLNNIWQKLVYSVSLLSLFALLLSPVSATGRNMTPAECEGGTICSKAVTS